MNWRALKYLSIFTLPLTVIISFNATGYWVFLPVIYVFAIIPLLELLFRPNVSNLSLAEEEMAKEDRIYDVFLWCVVPVQLGFMIAFLLKMNKPNLTLMQQVGYTLSMGMMCGAMAINVGHELGHRTNKIEQFLAKILLTSSMYTHFFIEHNRGHHKRVGTLDDPATERFNEPLYVFWMRSIVFQYVDAWKLEFQRMKVINASKFSIKNQMVQISMVQLVLLFVLHLFFGWLGVFSFLLAAWVGILMLETVNYIEHYGLQRTQISEKRFERVQPHHSWNSNHMIGRLLLFELSRHSDHHFLADRKYQILRHHENSLQMPTGYPGMMVLSFIPPLFFKVVNPLIKRGANSAQDRVPTEL